MTLLFLWGPGGRAGDIDHRLFRDPGKARPGRPVPRGKNERKVRMARLEAISLVRNYGTVVLDHLPNENEFRALAVMLKGVDQLLAGQEPTDPDFVEHFMHSPEVLRRMPVLASKTQ